MKIYYKDDIVKDTESTLKFKIIFDERNHIYHLINNAFIVELTSVSSLIQTEAEKLELDKFAQENPDILEKCKQRGNKIHLLDCYFYGLESWPNNLTNFDLKIIENYVLEQQRRINTNFYKKYRIWAKELIVSDYQTTAGTIDTIYAGEREVDGRIPLYIEDIKTGSPKDADKKQVEMYKKLLITTLSLHNMNDYYVKGAKLWYLKK